MNSTRAKKKQKLKVIRFRARHASTYFAMCSNGLVELVNDRHFDWTTGYSKCNCLKCAKLHDPGIMLGVLIKGMVMASKKKSGHIFVDLGNQRCYNVEPYEFNGKFHIDPNAHAKVDGKIVRLIVNKFETKLAGLL